jgi:uncharacterized protein YjbJ (UPF0337 family)
MSVGTDDKARDKAEELTGKGQKKLGQAIGDQEMEAEGRAGEAKGNLKQAGEKVKDAFKG